MKYDGEFCGHIGFGQFCHRCAQAGAIELSIGRLRAPEVQAAKQAEADRLWLGARQTRTKWPKAL